MQDKPKLFSTVLMWMLAELFEQLPEVGDLDKPKLVFFFDEAHLLFDDATKAFLDSVERTVRMIRSKGVGVFFVTQQPTDVPSSVLGQLGNRIQHALRAFTPEDADALRKTVRTYPTSELYDLEQLLTSLGIGEAAVTVLNEKGVPTPVVHTRLRAPRVEHGAGARRRAAREGVDALDEVRHAARARERGGGAREARRGRAGRSRPPAKTAKPKPAKPPSDPLTDFLTSRQGKALQREVVRGMFGMLRKRL